MVTGRAMNILWIQNVREAFSRVYGDKRGAAVSNVVIPAVMGDFRRTVLAAEDHISVRETYRTDDRKTSVTITGHREAGATGKVCVIDRIEVGGQAVPLGGGKLQI